MAQATSDRAAAPAAIERLVKQLLLTARAVSLYPPSSDIPRTSLARLTEMLHEALESVPELRFGVEKHGIFFEGAPVSPNGSAYEAFALELYRRNLASFRFHCGIREADIETFLGIIAVPAEEIAATGGIESRLWEQGVDTITVTEARVTIVELDEDEMIPADLSREEIDELLSKAIAGGEREKRMLVRMILDANHVRDYLLGSASGLEVGGKEATTRLSALAKLAGVASADERPALLRALAEAVETLDPATRRQLLVDHLLPTGRTDEGIASVVRNMDLDGVCRALIAGLQPDEISLDGLARAIKNLALISMTDRAEVLDAAGAALEDAGFSPGVVANVFEMAAPSRLLVRETPEGSEPGQSAEAIFHLMDLAVSPNRAPAVEDPEIVSLREEAQRGFTDGDVVGALVSLVGLDSGDEAFARAMGMLEEEIAVLIERGDLEVAADVVDALSDVWRGSGLTPEQRRRIDDAIDQFGRARPVGTIVGALRLYRPGMPEHAAATRLLDSLGDRALESLLQLLADEPDMAARKHLIELLSAMAEGHISDFAARLGDPRWYVVRNVVVIMASTRQPSTLRYFERTVSHPEPRVRRETIRALASIPDRRATEMLITALADDDEQSVQLAARYLGLSGVRGAVPRLEQVARGEGQGNRDIGPRVEAIEALGRIGAEEAIPTLKSLAGRRGIMGGARGREVRSAASAALASLKGGAST